MPALSLPANLLVRPPMLDDADAVAALFNACSLDEIGVSDSKPANMVDSWQLPGFDRERDAWVIHSPDGRIVGYQDLWSPPSRDLFYADGCVHPAYRGQGIGAVLLRLAEARTREYMAQAPADTRILLAVRVNATNQPAASLLRSHGYAVRRHFSRMEIQFDHEPPVPVWPEGIAVRTLIPGQDERAVYEADEEAFQDHFDHMPIPYEVWLRWETGDHDEYDPSLWFLATAGDQIAGFAVCRPTTTEDPDIGWVGTLGVRRPWRRLGIGEALLRHAFHEFYRRGRRKVGLNVDAASLTGATRLYERVGMRVVRQKVQYAKELRPGREPER